MTLPGLPLPPGEPAINPAPREMIRANIGEVAAHYAVGADAEVEISVPGGEKIAERTLASFSCGGSGIFPVLSQAAISLGSYYEEVMPGGMAYVDAVGRYDSVVALDKVTDVGGNQCIRSPGDRSIDNATVLQIKAWRKSRQIVRIVDRHSGVWKSGSRRRRARRAESRRMARGGKWLR